MKNGRTGYVNEFSLVVAAFSENRMQNNIRVTTKIVCIRSIRTCL